MTFGHDVTMVMHVFYGKLKLHFKNFEHGWNHASEWSHAMSVREWYNQGNVSRCAAGVIMRMT